MLRLTEPILIETKPCPTCSGKGKVPCPPTYGVRNVTSYGPGLQPSAHHPIPCPQCKGKKVVPI